MGLRAGRFLMGKSIISMAKIGDGSFFTMKNGDLMGFL
jgi:hypothetical protein